MWKKPEVKPKGTVRVVMTNPKTRKRFSLEFVVVRECLTPALIGAKAAQQMKLLTIHNENVVSTLSPKRKGRKVNHLSRVKELVKQYPEVFDRQLGRFPGEVKIGVDENTISQRSHQPEECQLH